MIYEYEFVTEEEEEEATNKFLNQLVASDGDHESYVSLRARALASLQRLDFRRRSSLSELQTEVLLIMLHHPAQDAALEAGTLTQHNTIRFPFSLALDLVLQVADVRSSSVLDDLDDGIDELSLSGRLLELDPFDPTPYTMSSDTSITTTTAATYLTTMSSWDDDAISITSSEVSDVPPVVPHASVAIQVAMDPLPAPAPAPAPLPTQPPPRPRPVVETRSLLYLTEQRMSRQRAEERAARAKREVSITSLQLAETEHALRVHQAKNAELQASLSRTERILAQLSRSYTSAVLASPPPPASPPSAPIPGPTSSPVVAPVTPQQPLVRLERHVNGELVTVTHPLWPSLAAAEEAERQRRESAALRRRALISRVESLITSATPNNATVTSHPQPPSQ